LSRDREEASMKLEGPARAWAHHAESS